MLGDHRHCRAGLDIGFAGARVIEQTIREKLSGGLPAPKPDGDGTVDMVCRATNCAQGDQVIGALGCIKTPAARCGDAADGLAPPPDAREGRSRRRPPDPTVPDADHYDSDSPAD